MSLALGLAIYMICWWLVLFAVLPIGVRTQDEAGSVEPGTPGSAPATPNLRLKLAATTAIAALIFSIVYVLIVYEPITLDNIPFLPRFAPMGR